MKCRHYEQNKCVSCQWIEKPYYLQLQDKQKNLRQHLDIFYPKNIFDSVPSPEFGFRNKAKMAVLGTVENPILGIVTNNEPIDLCDCPLYSVQMKFVLYKLKKFIKKLQLVPYNVRRKKGEIKFVIVTESQGQYMLRFVLRSEKEHGKISSAITDLQLILPQIVVVSINIQPEHAAILEGDREIILTKQSRLPVILNEIPLFIEKGGFFQTNTFVASKLYKTAQSWLTDLPIKMIWDLFCGVGGFGLHCITKERELVGIEINPEAIECAKLSAKLMQHEKIKFQSLDATEFVSSKLEVKPDVILANPPRRGLGADLVNYLQKISPYYILYSSCNLQSLVNDLTFFSDYNIQYAQLFDMFPHTEHMEILVMLQKNTNKESYENNRLDRWNELGEHSNLL